MRWMWCWGCLTIREGFNLSLRVNFVDGGEESERPDLHRRRRNDGDWRGTVCVNRVPREKEPGLTIDTFPKAMQAQIEAEYRKKYPKQHLEGPPAAGIEKYVAPEGYSDSYDHFKNFFASVRSRKPVVEDAVFGYRAAGAALLSNLSIRRSRW